MEKVNALVLVANPGSASRKYALYDGPRLLMKVHFEYEGDQIVYSCQSPQGSSKTEPAGVGDLSVVATKIFDIFVALGLLTSKDQVETIGLRVVAPSSYFQVDRVLNASAENALDKLRHRSALHIEALLKESDTLRQIFPEATLVAVSDSAFHASMPATARHYAINTNDAKNLDVYRFGYHGLSVESAIRKLVALGKLPSRLIICHLGSGASITAVKNGKSVDCSMGYSPLEGLMMATRSGDIDITAAQVLQAGLGLDDHQLHEYLGRRSGLLGVSGRSSDIRELLKDEQAGHEPAGLALDMYVYRTQQAIGKMTASLGGLEALIFTGTVGERSAEMRRRIIKNLAFLGLSLDPHLNHTPTPVSKPARLSPIAHPVKIYVVPADEDAVIATHARKLVS